MPVFSHPMRIKDYESLLVLPLLVKDEVIGTFTVAAQRPGAFPTDKREMLGVIANQVAISMANARMYEVVEEQATTDGLTGLVNHRTFQERFSNMLGRAERRGFAVSLLLTDIDHFKKVNDSYGHPTGDEVLRRVAAILKASARKIDIVARYGGEEFAIVLEETDRQGAFQLAERFARRSSSRASPRSRGPSRRRCRSAWPATPTTPAKRPTSSPAPISRSTPPSTAAATAPSASPISNAPSRTGRREVTSRIQEPGIFWIAPLLRGLRVPTVAGPTFQSFPEAIP